MRVVAGIYRHRIIEMTNLETTRETQDRVREAIFASIGPYFSGGNALDLFAGSGAMGIEALSRGVDKIYLNDLNNEALKVCKKNCKSLGITDVVYTNLDWKDFLLQCNEKFSLIFLDPPYKMINVEEMLTHSTPLLEENGRIIFEMAKETKYPVEFKGLEFIKEKTYGIKKVITYRRRDE